MTISDEELVESAKMLAAQLSDIHKKLVRRNIEPCVLTYADGEITVEYERVIRKKF
jgi:hypothetical protein